ncbi:ornithine cyclodeaminase family protein [Niallia sp. MER 6]|uniref:ornithine cyclodeaminase family protein n=1 Tax=Niallia sp. MER 6 TaxID=2939567 RepID=UPI00203B05F4|nr:ornithine cyclodeaminase family protein [Niallia sp. MER 6]MCM3033396.1 ornithine cyclodeaminase family protein [Niallia sp. MER 6]
MLILSQKQIRTIYPMEDCLEDVRKAFLYDAQGETITPVRTAVEHEKAGGTSLIMPSYLKPLDYAAVKVITIFPNNEQGNPALKSVILLTETQTGKQTALMDASFLTVLRTGAASGVATDHLARKNARSAAILGCGAQALGQVQAVMAVRNLEQLVLYNRTTEKAVEFAEVISSLYPDWNGEIKIAKTGNDAVKEADIIVCSTKSTEPLFDGSHIRPGTHINAIGAFKPQMREVDLVTLKRCSKIVVDTIEGARDEAGDLLIPEKAGQWSFDMLYGELGELVAGRKAGRTSEDEITLYKSVGVAYLDTAVAAAVFMKAVENGVGYEVAL